MTQNSRLDDLYGKVGGIYKTTVLIQKRLRELNRGARRLVSDESKNPISTVMREIENDRIELVEDNEENRERIRAEIERMTAEQAPAVSVEQTTNEDELERRIMTALQKPRPPATP